jgi:Mrp family chromosome partitioning ATPase
VTALTAAPISTGGAGPGDRPADELTEAVRGLMARLPWDGNDKCPPLRALGFVGCAGGEGVSTLAVTLAVESATTLREPVLLADAHFDRPAAHRLLGVRPGPGLADALRDGMRLTDLVQLTAVPFLSVLAAGADPAVTDDAPGPAGLVESLRDEFALVVWDLPPAAGRMPAAEFAPHLDGLVLVVEAERTPEDVVRRAADRLARNARLLGIVLNKRPAHVPDWLGRFL